MVRDYVTEFKQESEKDIEQSDEELEQEEETISEESVEEEASDGAPEEELTRVSEIPNDASL